MENLFLIGFTNYMGLELSISAKFAEILAIGDEELSKSISLNGDIPMA